MMMHRSSMTILVFGLMASLTSSLFAVEPAVVDLGRSSVTVKIDENNHLALSTNSDPFVPFQSDLPDVTNVAATKWIDGAGIFLIAEVEGFNDKRSYWWFTVRVNSTEKESIDKNSVRPTFQIAAKGRFFENIQPLQILKVSSPGGDSVQAYLLDEADIPGTDRKLIYRFNHDCPRFEMTGMAEIHRAFLSPDAVEKIRMPKSFD